MIAYSDSSAISRVLFNEPGQIDPSAAVWDRVATSHLTRVEVSRSILRQIAEGMVTATAAETLLRELWRLLEYVDLLPIDERVIDLASVPFPGHVKSFDAIHLASAILLRQIDPGVVIVTHDRQLARAARALEFEVIGLDRG